MRRRSRAGGEPVKTRRDKTATLKRRNAPKTVRRRGLSIAKLQEQLDRRTRELSEALEQQIATSDVLRIISNSPTDAQPVFDAIIGSAVRMCDARFGAVFRLDRGVLHLVAHHNLRGGAARAAPAGVPDEAGPRSNLWPPMQFCAQAGSKRREMLFDRFARLPSEPEFLACATKVARECGNWLKSL